MAKNVEKLKGRITEDPRIKTARKIPQLIAVIHLSPLVGAPGSAGLSATQSLNRAGAWAVEEAKKLESLGFDGLIIENFGDAPFYKEKVGPETVAAMSIIAAAVHDTVKIPVGVNVLRNDSHSALAIAAVSGCEFIRVNVLSGVYATDQGLIEGQAAQLLRERQRISANVAIMADVLVKHAKPLSTDNLELSIEENALRAGAQGIILTGETTGRAVDFQLLVKASKICQKIKTPLFVGSGVTAESVSKILKLADGVIVGSCLRENAQAGSKLDDLRIKKFIKNAKNI